MYTHSLTHTHTLTHTLTHTHTHAHTHTHTTHPPLWADAVYLLFPQPVQSVHSAHSEGSRKGRGDHDGDDIQCPVDGLLDIVVLHLLYYDCVAEPKEGCRGEIT